MSIRIVAQNAIRNPAVPVAPAGELSRFAYHGAVALWDCTDVTGTTLADQSGNGNTMTFTATPTITSEGFQFDGSIYADATLALLENDFSMFEIIKSTAFGYHSFGCYSVSANDGIGFRHYGTRVDSAGGDSGNTITGATISNTAYYMHILNYTRWNQGRMRLASGGTLDWRHSLRHDGSANARTLWRLGAAATTADAAYLTMTGGVMAYCGVFDHALSERQIAALFAVMQTTMAARSITLN